MRLSSLPLVEVLLLAVDAVGAFQVHGRVTISGRRCGILGSSSSNNNSGGGSPSTPPNSGESGASHKASSAAMAEDEYDAIVLYPKNEIPFFLQETDEGEAAFAGYVQWDEPCSTIRSIGDVIVAIDGASTAGSSIKEVIQFIQEKARKNAHSFFRFKSIRGNVGPAGGATVTTAAAAVGGPRSPGQLPGERQRTLLEQEIDQINRDVEAKIKQVEALQQQQEKIKQELAEIHRMDLEWIEQKRGALKKEEQDGGGHHHGLM